nr:MAG TPA: hypothetical protein [Caudoviricetes sp.]
MPCRSVTHVTALIDADYSLYYDSVLLSVPPRHLYLLVRLSLLR